MREIKYNAWDKVRKIMFYAYEMGEDQLTLSPDGKGFINVSSVSTKLSEYLKHLIPLEYTGLKDKNGKEIVEGDILKSCYNGYHSVVFRNGAFWIEHTEDCCKPWKGGLVSEVAHTDIVVGNIYENPELLEENK